MHKIFLTAILCSVFSAFTGAPETKAQSMMDQMIYSKCSSSMNDDYKQAGKVPPAGLVNKMCTCVVKEINKLHSIEGAKNLCVAEIGPGNS